MPEMVSFPVMSPNTFHGTWPLSLLCLQHILWTLHTVQGPAMQKVYVALITLEKETH